MTEEEFTDMRQGVRNELGVDSSGGSGIRSYKSRDQGRSGKSRAASFFGENQTPRVHKAAPRLLKNNSIEFGVQARMTPLKDCSDEQLLAELEQRNIHLHDKVTRDLVNSKYTFGKLLGQGSSAAVYAAVHNRSKVSVAIKVIKKNDDMNDDESMRTELEILKMIHHRYILNCHELYETPQCVWVVMEMIRGGELLDLLIDGGVYTEKDAARCIKQVFLAISYLHSQGVVHRDLKLQNLLLTEKDRNSDIKVGDFGLSAILPRGAHDSSDKETMKCYNKLSDRWGTPQYFAPEMLRKAYGPQVDIWALGVVLFQLLVGRLPFNASSNSDLFRLIDRSPEHLARLFALPEWNSVSEVARDLVTKLLEPDPVKRLNADEALQHPWVALKGAQGAGELKTAVVMLKKEVAQKRLTAMWHVLDIINALDASGAVKPSSHSPRAPKQLPPMLAKRASQGSVANLHSAMDAGSRPRQDSTGTDRMEELQNLFQMFDIDGNGTIDCDEIAALLKKLGFTPDEAKICEIVNRVDANNNGQLEFAEFCEFLKLAKQGVGLNQAVEQELDAYSAADGYISRDEISKLTRTFAETLGQHITDEDVEDVLALSIPEDEEGLQVKTTDVAKAMMMSPDRRKHNAEERRRQRSDPRGVGR